jgi:DNA-binding NarL/FixJ family response regulator
MASPETSTIKRTRVLLVDDHPMFREHLTMLLNRDLGMLVCGEADNIQDAAKLIETSKPDVAIVDITLRGSSGLELVKNLRAEGSELPVLVLSMHEEELYAERALRSGARGYISKNEASSVVVKAIQRVMEGEIYVSRAMNAKLLDKLTQRKATADSSGISKLADREIEVFQLLGKGRSTQQIALELNLGESTVETYRARIKEKLQLRSAAELYLRAGQWVKEHG